MAKVGPTKIGMGEKYDVVTAVIVADSAPATAVVVAVTAPAESTLTSKLADLTAARDAGLINVDEFADAKRALLGLPNLAGGSGGAAEAASATIGGGSPSSTYRFAFSSTRNAIANFTMKDYKDGRGNFQDSLQLSTVKLFDPAGRAISIVNAACPGGRPASGGEGPDSVRGDGGKWIDMAFRSNGCRSDLVLQLGATAVVGSYCFVTGNDGPGRDPASWVLYAGDVEVDRRDRKVLPEGRNAPTTTWYPGAAGGGSGGAAEAASATIGSGSSALSVEQELISHQWSGGKPGGGGESYESNPWSFRGDKTFVTLRDGCNGTWSCRTDGGAPGGVVLRMEWAAGQRGNWAEFAVQGPGSEPRLRATGASYGFMQSWNIKKGSASGGVTVTPAATKTIPPNPALNGQLNDCARNTNDASRLKDLVARGAVLESTNDGNWRHTALHQACYHGRPVMVRALLDVGAFEKCAHLTSNPCGRAGKGLPVELARGGGHHECVRLMDQYRGGASGGGSGAGAAIVPEMQGMDRTARAAIYDRARFPNGGPRGDQNVCCVTLLCLPNMVMCPLHCLAMWGCAPFVDCLTSLPCKYIPCSPCDPNAKQPLWFCAEPIGWAASHGQLHAVMVLVKNGANPRRFNGANNNAWTDAQRERHEHVVNWLNLWEAQSKA